MSNPTKRIGILSFKQQENGNITVPSAYASYFANFGTVVPIFALDEYLYRDIDMLVLVGGQDIDASRYEEKPSFFAGNPNIQLEWFDKFMLPQYINIQMPIFGICRGFQTLNVVFGGKLRQHIHQQYSTVTRGELVHDVEPTGYMNRMLEYFKLDKEKLPKMRVNSLHHQGAVLADLSERVLPLLTNPIHNNVEALWVVDSPIVAVQWHPEEIQDKFSNKMISTLLRWKQ